MGCCFSEEEPILIRPHEGWTYIPGRGRQPGRYEYFPPERPPWIPREIPPPDPVDDMPNGSSARTTERARSPGIGTYGYPDTDGSDASAEIGQARLAAMADNPNFLRNPAALAVYQEHVLRALAGPGGLPPDDELSSTLSAFPGIRTTQSDLRTLRSGGSRNEGESSYDTRNSHGTQSTVGAGTTGGFTATSIRIAPPSNMTGWSRGAPPSYRTVPSRGAPPTYMP